MRSLDFLLINFSPFCNRKFSFIPHTSGFGAKNKPYVSSEREIDNFVPGQRSTGIK